LTNHGLERPILTLDYRNVTYTEALKVLSDFSKKLSRKNRGMSDGEIQEMYSDSLVNMFEKLLKSPPESLQFRAASGPVRPRIEPVPVDDETLFDCSGPECENKTKTRCVGCGITHYCSKDCQRKDWKNHKTICNDAQAARAAAAAPASASCGGDGGVGQ
jgi:hypothetical protein